MNDRGRRTGAHYRDGDVHLIVTFVTCLFLLFLGPPTAQPQPDDDTLVQQFFPQSLIDEAQSDAAAGGPPPFFAHTFALFDFYRTGASDFIVAAYTNGFSAAVRVLRKVAGGASLVAAPVLPLMAGIYPRVSSVDIDGDGIPEAVVSLTSAKGASADWIFKWSGTTLILIGPTVTDANGDTSTLLRDADFIDLNGDGTLEIISAPQTAPSMPGDTEVKAPLIDVFQLSGTTYSLFERLNFFGTFVRRTGAPVAITRTFSVDATDVPYILRITNGGGPGKKRVTSAVIILNGAVLAGPSAFANNMPEIITPVTLQGTNVLSVELRGAPTSQLSISVRPQQ